MMHNNLQGFKIAMMVANGFEQIELTEPKKALEELGAKVLIISPETEKVQGFHHDKKADTFTVDISLDQANAHQFDALVLPGGVWSPDQLRNNPKAIKFIQDFAKQKKPIAAICHGPWSLINANLVEGRTVTSWPSLKLDLINAGAVWIDEPVVKDNLLITSRKPDDIPFFNKAIIEVFLEQQEAA